MRAASDVQVILAFVDLLVQLSLRTGGSRGVGELLALITGALSLTPALISSVFTLADDAGICEARVGLCDNACSLLVQRCDACLGNATCEDTLIRVCGAERDSCE